MELLQKHFDTALESPDGIKKLRELILTLAMQGKLVKQDPKDQPASELLKEIQTEKERLIKAGKIKKQKELPLIKAEDVPYAVPKGWEWVQLGKIILEMDAGWSPKCEDRCTKANEWGVLKTTAVQKLQFLEFENKALPFKLQPRPDAEVRISDILITRAGPTNRVGICCVVKNVRKQLMLSDKIIRFRCVLEKQFPDFVALALNTGFGKKQIDFYKSGMAASQVNISQDKLQNCIIAYPPMSEQRRIVAKIEELMALCDTLESQRNARSEKRLAVHTAAINRLLTAADKSEFDTSWQFITRHFDPLYSVKENVVELKKAILTLAMQGKLVKQDPKDQPASELLKEIEAEKERLIKAGKIKKQKELPPIKAEDVPYAVPMGWEWVRLGEIFTYEYGDSLPSEKRTNTGEYPVYGSNGIVGTHNKANVKNKCIVIGRKGSAGALNLCNYTSCWVTDVAYSCVPPKNFDLIFALNLFKTMNLDVLGKGIKPGLNRNEAYILPIPLPPLAEQKRIVDKIDELMALCDTLEKQIDQASAKQTTLFDAVLAQV